MFSSLVAKAGSTVVTGMVGAAAYDGLRRSVRTGAAREVTVQAIALGLRGKRRAEIGAERVRLGGGDLLAEARERVGEQAPPPVATEAHDH